MDTVTLDPPAAVIAERQRLGLDRFDEVWDGEYHMVPGPNVRHQELEVRLLVALDPVVRAAGLRVLAEINLLASEALGFADFRIPDLAVYRPDHAAVAGIVGDVPLVVEIRSPGDESWEKLGFYERLGVGEVLVIDRDTAVVRRWVNRAEGLVETPGDPVGTHRLSCVPVTLHADDGVLVVTTDLGVTRM